MFDWLYSAFGSMLSWFNTITGSYALALLLYALVFKILFLPFAIKQQKTQIKMAALRPKIAQIEKKYAGRNDQITLRKKQEEIMTLQQQEGASPLSGCLPLLLQFPIIIFLYNVIRNPLSYIMKLSGETVDKLKAVIGEGASSDQITLISQLQTAYENGSAHMIDEAAGAENFISGIPNFNLFGVNLAEKPSFATILVLIPILAAAFQWLTMFISRKINGNQNPGMDQQSQMSMRIMDLLFPLLTLWMAFSFSGMLGLYWIYQSVLGIVQIIVLAKAMPLPKFTDEELREMERAAKAQEKAQREIMKTQPKYKSLHYIDEDDYDDLPEIQSKNNNKNIADDAPVLKDDRDKR